MNFELIQLILLGFLCANSELSGLAKNRMSVNNEIAIHMKIDGGGLRNTLPGVTIVLFRNIHLFNITQKHN